MPLPRTVMIDTNVFDQHAYHFASPTIQKFVDLSKTDDDDLRGIVKAIRLSRYAMRKYSPEPVLRIYL